LLGTSWLVVGAVAVSTVAMYVLVVLIVRVLGQRSLAALTVVDLACVVALGAIIGRTSLLATPTLVSGVTAVVTLFAARAVLRAVGINPALGRTLNRQPVLLMDGPTALTDNLRRAHVSDADLRQALRLAGISRVAQVRCVVLERNGQISVLRADGDLDPDIVADIPQLGAEAR
jgi:uncharacterized membrane protein YcaP (DUF421 family)